VLLVATMPAETARCQRSDARENRDRILAAAAQAFADDGLSVSLIEIARRARVGNATLHRNFTKEQLSRNCSRTGTPAGKPWPSARWPTPIPGTAW
jgi:hypothetical protein